MNLTVTPAGQDVVTPITVCELDLPFVFGGQSFTQSGSFVISTGGACGGSEILNLTVTPAGQDVVTPVTVCELDLPFVFGGQNFTQAGSFVVAVGACGGSEILQLTVTPAAPTVSTPVTVCSDDLPFVFGGQSFTQSGTFTITAGGACGGGEVLVLTVAQAPAVNLVSSTNASCALGAIGTAQVSATGGQAPFTYQWNDANSQTTAQAVNLPAGTFTVVVTDSNGCSESLAVTIGENDDCRIDIALTKQVDRSVVSVGETVQFTITATNEGNIAATGVQITDPVPSGFINLSNISNGGSLTGSTITWSGINLAVNESIQLTFTAEVAGGAVSYTNVAQVTASDQQDADSAPNNDNGDQSEDDEDSATAAPETTDISIIKSVSNDNPRIRDIVTYTIVVTNEGTVDATGVEVTDYLPIDFCVNFTNISGNGLFIGDRICLLYTSPSPRDRTRSRMPSSA